MVNRKKMTPATTRTLGRRLETKEPRLVPIVWALGGELKKVWGIEKARRGFFIAVSKEVNTEDITDNLGEEVRGENNQQADKAIEHLFLGSLDFGGIAKAGQIGEGGENEAEGKVEPGQADGKKKGAGGNCDTDKFEGDDGQNN